MPWAWRASAVFPALRLLARFRQAADDTIRRGCVHFEGNFHVASRAGTFSPIKDGDAGRQFAARLDIPSQIMGAEKLGSRWK